jgi:hypothetical protein
MGLVLSAASVIIAIVGAVTVSVIVVSSHRATAATSVLHSIEVIKIFKKFKNN